jgi:hypothetical protein
MTEYYVYLCEPSCQYPFRHWKYFSTATPVQELPDIREQRPLYVWSDITGFYTPISRIAISGQPA